MKNMSGQAITAESGKKYDITEEAGSGGQGVVYKEASGKYMIKLYYPSDNPQTNNDMAERLKMVRDVKKPQNFVNICDLITNPYIGYVMNRVNDHAPLSSYLIFQGGDFSKWYNAGFGFRERLNLGYFIAKAFEELSADHLAYCDISGNNILVKITTKGPSTSISVRMIDIDNIYMAGRDKTSVLGTPRYIAPEVINKEKDPDVFSDNYSLAVILFELLRVGHPYISDEVINGTPEDEEAALAGKAEYVTDDNSENMLPADVVFTNKLKELFKHCFVEGKYNRMSRPRAKDFQFALLEASNKVIKCASCNAWHYPRENEECPWCNAESKHKAILNFYDGASDKLVTSYMLREGINQVKSFYVLRTDDAKINAEDYLLIAKDNKGYHAYNKFDKESISVKSGETKEFQSLGKREDIILKSGDEIHFGKNNQYICIAKFQENKT
jgi:DNA-binding helix-hairpin-helix protein with protein kinase domain